MSPKEHILTIAEDLFCQNGYHQASIRDIADRAKINSSMINYHFQSKENLYLIILNKFKVALESIYNCTNDENSSNPISLFIKKSFSAAKKNPKIVILLVAERLQPSSPKTKNIVDTIQNRHYGEFLKTVTKCTEKYPLKSDLNSKFLYHSIFGMLQEMIITEFLSNEASTDRGFDEDEIERYVDASFFQGRR